MTRKASSGPRDRVLQASEIGVARVICVIRTRASAVAWYGEKIAQEVLGGSVMPGGDARSLRGFDALAEDPATVKPNQY